jgi:hypothetical protein
MSGKYINIFPIYTRPSKIFPNWDYWFENKPSGSPGRREFLFLAPPSSSSSSSSVSLKASLSNRWRSAKLDLRKLAADGYVAAPPSIDTGSML